VILWDKIKQHVDVMYISPSDVVASGEEKLYCKLKHMQIVVVLSLETARCYLNMSNISNYTDSETPHCFYLDFIVLIMCTCTLSQNQFRDVINELIPHAKLLGILKHKFDKIDECQSPFRQWTSHILYGKLAIHVKRYS